LCHSAYESDITVDPQLTRRCMRRSE